MSGNDTGLPSKVPVTVSAFQSKSSRTSFSELLEPSLKLNDSGRMPAGFTWITLRSCACELIATRASRVGNTRVSYCHRPAAVPCWKLDSISPPFRRGLLLEELARSVGEIPSGSRTGGVCGLRDPFDVEGLA